MFFNWRLYFPITVWMRVRSQAIRQTSVSVWKTCHIGLSLPSCFAKLVTSFKGKQVHWTANENKTEAYDPVTLITFFGLFLLSRHGLRSTRYSNELWRTHNFLVEIWSARDKNPHLHILPSRAERLNVYYAIRLRGVTSQNPSHITQLNG